MSHSYCYSTLGTNCTPQTLAWTNDNKYLMPDANVYNRVYTYMYRYPSEDSTYTDDKLGQPHHPEQIKAFNIPPAPGHKDVQWDKENRPSFVSPTQHKRPATCGSCSH